MFRTIHEILYIIKYVIEETKKRDIKFVEIVSKILMIVGLRGANSAHMRAS